MAASLRGETSLPVSSVRLALIAQDPAVQTTADLLAVELSQKKNLQLLERSEIERVYREQKLSASNKDRLKLGQILGADGLLLLSHIQEGTNQFLQAHLIAVKPGVLLDASRSPMPINDPADWARGMANHLDPLLPKLSVLVKDAIPISMINLRAAQRSATSQETERELTLLTIERLARERELFVLERRRMDLLSEEARLNGLENASFWNGSYLLEGVIDRDGYSKETMTLSARLSPPQGGTPIPIEVSGKRDDLPALVEQLSRQVLATLHRQSSTPEWKPAEEAAQFYSEAQWALRWKLPQEAQVASEAAWALGKRDMDGALVRVKSYLADLMNDSGIFENGFADIGNDPKEVAATIRSLPHSYGLTTDIYDFGNSTDIHYVRAKRPPEPKEIETALHALELYEEFSRTLSADTLQITSPWYELGIDLLNTASRVLVHVHFVPSSDPNLIEKTPELRLLARSVAGWLSKAPSIYASYHVGDRIATAGELYHTIGEAPNIWRCETEFGCFWQEKPEDAIALYRELMESPVFCYVHQYLWNRPLQEPRLASWSQGDRVRNPSLWKTFLGELHASTNLLVRMEGEALDVADARNEKDAETSLHTLFETILTNRETIVSNNVDLLSSDWQIGDLVTHLLPNRVNPTKEKLEHEYYRDFLPKLAEMRRNYWDVTTRRSQYEQLKECLRNNTPFDFKNFMQYAQSKFTREQAIEIQPLLAAYQSNLVAQAQNKNPHAKIETQAAASWIGYLEVQVKSALNPQSKPVAVFSPPPKPSIPEPKKAEAAPFLITRFMELSGSLLSEKSIGLKPGKRLYREGRYWIDVHYTPLDKNGGYLTEKAALMAWDPQSDQWQALPLPTTSYNDFEILNGTVFLSQADGLALYDLKTGPWRNVAVPGLNGARLFVVDGHLYSASAESIVEIMDGGTRTSILASARRRPAVSPLDEISNYGEVRLFPGTNHTLRACIATRNFEYQIYGWDGHAWSLVVPAKMNRPPEIFEDGVVYSAQSPTRMDWRRPPALSLLRRDQNKDELRVREEDQPVGSPEVPHTLCQTPCIPAEPYFFFYAEHCSVTNQSMGWTVEEKDGRHAELIRLDRSYHRVVVPLKFDVAQGPVPSLEVGWKRGGIPAGLWLDFVGDFLIIGYASTPNLVATSARIGFWIASKKELQAVFEQQERILRWGSLEKVDDAGQKFKAALARFDFNHNGTLEPEEKEAAIDDPAFLASQLAAIDENQNGQIDLEELVFFDANRNGILEPRENAAFEITLGLLADEILSDFDFNHDGQVDATEITNSKATNRRTTFSFPGDWKDFDDNHDDLLNKDEIQNLLRFYSRIHVRSKTQFFYEGNLLDLRLKKNSAAQKNFQAGIESFWKNQAVNPKEQKNP